MPLTTLFGAAAVSGGASLWQYNRENFMFNVPVRQAKLYQLQSVMISRYGLFREDVRDLCALTTNKVQSYLIVNTLKLGFIITIFFNFDRTDSSREASDFEEIQIDVLFSMLLLTAFFWLLQSVWFSIYALVIAQSLTTKLLVRVVRIPLPSREEIMDFVPETDKFERSVGDAFRVPLLSRPDPSEAENSGGPVRPRKSSGGTHTHLHAHAESSSNAFGKSPLSSSQHGGGKRSQSPPDNVPPTEEWRFDPVSIMDVLYDRSEIDSEELGDSFGMEPHIKLLNLLKACWEPFDFYSKVSMELGTATMLSGLGYYGLYYLRVQGATFEVEAAGWCCFVFMSVLAWISLVFELSMPFWQQAGICMLMMAGPITMFTGYDRHRMHWMLPCILAFTGSWVVLACWLGVSRGRRWPAWWAAAFWLNALHSERGPPPTGRDLPGRLEEIGVAPKGTAAQQQQQQHSQLHSKLLPRSNTGSTDASSHSSSESVTRRDPHAQLFATMLIACLDCLLDWPLKRSVRSRIRKERDTLYESAQAVGAFAYNRRKQRHALEGFWLLLPGERDHPSSPEWLDPDGCGDPDTATTVNLEELLRGVSELSQQLYDEAVTWSVRDMRELFQYGGEPVLGIRSFTAQFHRHGSGATANVGHAAFGFYFGGTVLVTGMWIFALMLSCSSAYYRPHTSLVLGTTFHQRASVPLPWLEPTNYGCDAGATLVVLSDTSSGTFFSQWDGPHFEQQTNIKWSGPYDVCENGPLLSADIGENNRTWALCEDGLRSFDVDLRTGLFSLSPFAGGKGLQLIALDSSPRETAIIVGLGVRNGNLVGLRRDRSRSPHGKWQIMGTFNAPAGAKWEHLTLREGRGFLLDTSNRLWKLNVETGHWDAPWQMPDGFNWHGLCELPDEVNLLVWGQRKANKNIDVPSEVELMWLRWALAAESDSGLWARIKR